MKRIMFTAFILSFIITGHSRTTANQKDVQRNNETSQSHVPEPEPETTNLSVAPSNTKQNKQVALDPIITQAINFSNAIGDWFEDLFDKKQNMSLNAHVNELEKIIDAMQAAIIAPLVTEKDHDVTLLAAYNLTSTLYARAEKTFKTLNDHKSNPGFMKVSNALKKIDKKFSSDQERAKLKKAFKNLTAQLGKSDAVLCKKVTKLELVVAENSTRTKQKGWWTLAWGLRHRLQCE